MTKYCESINTEQCQHYTVLISVIIILTKLVTFHKLLTGTPISLVTDAPDDSSAAVTKRGAGVLVSRELMIQDIRNLLQQTTDSQECKAYENDNQKCQ